LWLCPIEDRRELDSPLEGMILGFSLGSYVKLVDYTGRLFREGKASISAELAEVFERLGCSAQSWQIQIEKLCGIGCWADSSRPAAKSCAKSANASVCVAWSTCGVVRFDDSTIKRGLNRAVAARSLCRGMDAQRLLEHI
jgi:hypothetical protein